MVVRESKNDNKKHAELKEEDHLLGDDNHLLTPPHMLATQHPSQASSYSETPLFINFALQNLTDLFICIINENPNILKTPLKNMYLLEHALQIKDYDTAVAICKTITRYKIEYDYYNCLKMVMKNYLSFKFMKLILKHIDQTDDHYVIKAFRFKSEEIVRFLIFNLSHRNDVFFLFNGFSFLHLAVIFNMPSIVKIFLKFPSVLNAPSHFNLYNALHLSIYKKNFVIFDILINLCSLDSVTQEGYSCLHLCIFKDQEEMAKKLINRFPKILEINDSKGISPTQYAILMSREKILTAILESQGIENTLKFFPILNVIKSSNPYMKQLLTAFLMKDNDNTTENKGLIFHTLAVWKNCPISEYIFQIYDFSSSNNWCFNKYLHIAARRNNSGFIRLAAEFGWDLDYIDGYGNVPLHYASMLGHTEAVIQLIKYKANVFSMNYNMETPIMMASQYGHLEIVKYLIEAKSRLDIININSMTALDLAFSGFHAEVCILLVKGGANFGSYSESD